MTELPPGWECSTLGQLGEYLNGRGFKKSEWRDSGRPIIRIQNLTGSSESFNYFDGEAEERHAVRDGDLLVSWAATLGVFVWRGPEAVLNQHIFKAESFVDPEFHRYLLEHALADLQRQTHGSGMVHITKGRFNETPVLLPPLQEQRRIVEAIERHLEGLDAGTQSLAGAEERLRRMKLAAVDLALAGEWPERCLAEHTVDQRYGSSAKASPAGGEDAVPVLRMGNIVDGTLDYSDLKYLPVDHEDVEACELRTGDLLFNRTNSPELVGKSAVFEDVGHPVTFASYLIRVRLDERLDPRWAATVINSPRGREYIDGVRTQQVGQSNVNGTKLKNFPVPIPPIEVQRDRLATLDETNEEIMRLQREIGRAQRRASSLRRAVLAAALSGQLVPQDPVDEPASELLARIRAEKPAKRRSKRSVSS